MWEVIGDYFPAQDDDVRFGVHFFTSSGELGDFLSTLPLMIRFLSSSVFFTIAS